MIEAVILLGAPGSGKGTTAEDVENASDYIHVSTGDMLREAIRDKNQVGLRAESIMEKGELVPDDVIMDVVRNRIEMGEPDARYLFDGFPRTVGQAGMLEEFLSEDRRGFLKNVFLLEVPRETIVDRLEGRRICRKCGSIYHVRNFPSKKEDICDECGGELYQRLDDSRETVLNRLDVYEEQTGGLIDYYDRKGVLMKIDASDRQKTLNLILDALRG